MPSMSQHLSSPLAEAAQAHADDLLESSNNRRDSHTPLKIPAPPNSEAPTSTTTNTSSNHPQPHDQIKPYISKIGILTSSLPVYHNAFMDAKKKDAQRQRLQEQGKPIEPDELKIPKLSLEGRPREQSSEEQAATIKHLKPHSRSTIQLQNITKEPILQEGGVMLDMRSKSKHKSTKWQFGIRSRNEPVDAIKCLYRALNSMGDCQWRTEPPKDKSQPNADSGPYPVSVLGATHLPSSNHNLSESPERERRLHQGPSPTNQHDQPHTQPHNDSPSNQDAHIPTQADGNESEADDEVDPNFIPEGYVPKDPWCINVRWEKKGMTPPGTTTTSAQSSAVDLPSTNTDTSTLGYQRRSSLANSLGSSVIDSAAGSTTSVTLTPTLAPSAAESGGGGVGPPAPAAETACFVYLDLQIYVLETDIYLVDFKNAGYEPIIGERRKMRQSSPTVEESKLKQQRDGAGGGGGGGGGAEEMESVGNGQRKGEKDVTSPQPFLDLANKLVIHLARGAQ